MTNEEATNVLRIMASGIELKGYTEHWISSFKEAYEMAIKALEERPHGKWIYQCCFGDEYPQCSVCGEINDVKSRFCPDCGADMRKGSAE